MSVPSVALRAPKKIASDSCRLVGHNASINPYKNAKKGKKIDSMVYTQQRNVKSCSESPETSSLCAHSFYFVLIAVVSVGEYDLFIGCWVQLSYLFYFFLLKFRLTAAVVMNSGLLYPF